MDKSYLKNTSKWWQALSPEKRLFYYNRIPRDSRNRIPDNLDKLIAFMYEIYLADKGIEVAK
jgi:hypothetical protein